MGDTNRRWFLRSLGAVGIGTLTGCLGSGGSPASPDPGTGSSDADTATAGVDDGGATTETPDVGEPTPSAVLHEEASASGRWGQWRRGAGNSGTVSDGTGPASAPKVKWKAPESFGFPLVADGSVFVAQVGNERVVAMSASDGRRQWTRDVTPRTQGAVVDGTLVVPTKGDETRLTAFSTTSGESQWTLGEDELPKPVIGPPTVADGTIYVSTLTSEGDAQEIRALSPADGANEWTATLERSQWNQDNPVTVVDGAVCGASSKAVVAFDAADGSELWTREFPDSVQTPKLTAADGTLYARYYDEQTRLAAIEPADGSLQWEAKEAMKRWVAPTADRVYFTVLGPSNQEGAVGALSADDGSREWHVELDGEVQEPVVIGDTVYFTNNETLFAFDGTDGTKRWEVGGDGRRFAGVPVVAGETVFVPGKSEQRVMWALGPA